MVDKNDFAYTPDDIPSHWKLNISDREHCIAAKAALGPGGFRGKKVEIPENARDGVIRKLNAACKKFGLQPFGKQIELSQSDIQNGKNSLEHFGILGMKWGVRRDRKTLDRLAGRKAKTDGDKTSEKTEKPKTVKELSDTELRNRVNRLNMEKQYNDLLQQKANGFSTVEKSAGRKYASAFADKAIDRAGNVVLDVVANNILKPALEKQLKSFGKKKG